MIKPEGVVILHDAQKIHYHEGLNVFPHGKFINSGTWYPLQEVSNSMWIGSINNHPIFEKLKAF